jgi:hypothetical protein
MSVNFGWQKLNRDCAQGGHQSTPRLKKLQSLLMRNR